MALGHPIRIQLCVCGVCVCVCVFRRPTFVHVCVYLTLLCLSPNPNEGAERGSEGCRSLTLKGRVVVSVSLQNFTRSP